MGIDEILGSIPIIREKIFPHLVRIKYPRAGSHRHLFTRGKFIKNETGLIIGYKLATGQVFQNIQEGFITSNGLLELYSPQENEYHPEILNDKKIKISQFNNETQQWNIVEVPAKEHLPYLDTTMVSKSMDLYKKISIDFEDNFFLKNQTLIGAAFFMFVVIIMFALMAQYIGELRSVADIYAKGALCQVAAPPTETEEKTGLGQLIPPLGSVILNGQGG